MEIIPNKIKKKSECFTIKKQSQFFNRSGITPFNPTINFIIFWFKTKITGVYFVILSVDQNWAFFTRVTLEKHEQSHVTNFRYFHIPLVCGEACQSSNSAHAFFFYLHKRLCNIHIYNTNFSLGSLKREFVGNMRFPT